MKGIPGLQLSRTGCEWRWLCWVFSRVYRRWLWDDFYKCYDRVLAVKGWRTARTMHKGGQVRSMTPCFWRFQ